MAGIALLLDLLKKNPDVSMQSLHSYGLFSATVAASAAAASIAAGRPFTSTFSFRDAGTLFAFCDCDVSPAWTEEYISNLRRASENVFQSDSLQYRTKEYSIKLKPVFSAFELKPLLLTSLRSFLLFYLPLLEPTTNLEEDDDFLQDDLEEKHVNLADPFRKAVRQIICETTVVTTRRVLERLAVHYVSQRVAWKLLKDIPKSAKRKAERGMPTLLIFYSVSRTTLRGHFLGVLASWIVQVGLEIYRCISYKVDNDGFVDKGECFNILRRNISRTTVRCGGSLVFASFGAGIGATLFHPSMGQWIGCAVGDLAGPAIVAAFFSKVLPSGI